ncbi:MAG: hypothetical protein HRU18_01185 [Pseudoalteromonas sp.]|uniref:hypothetical protein n=1 Tax=Pseudoalteromonas sp. TaxID=53249 RepID=UPI001D50C4F1|nr:hypothetical protein [Pseudoalteromonas sp.]NRA76793.1 hypothetical protein [Pseudoalteromonas sp.]
MEQFLNEYLDDQLDLFVKNLNVDVSAEPFKEYDGVELINNELCIDSLGDNLFNSAMIALKFMLNRDIDVVIKTILKCKDSKEVCAELNIIEGEHKYYDDICWQIYMVKKGIALERMKLFEKLDDKLRELHAIKDAVEDVDKIKKLTDKFSDELGVLALSICERM